MAENFSPNCGINSRTKVIYSGVQTTVRVCGTNEFSLFQLEEKETVFTKNVSLPYMVSFQIIFENMVNKKRQF